MCDNVQFSELQDRLMLRVIEEEEAYELAVEEV
jgi:hypothetical protein